MQRDALEGHDDVAVDAAETKKDSMTTQPTTRFLGYVQVRIGGKIIALPVQIAALGHDADRAAGGLFKDAGGQLGILVDANGSEAARRDQIARASKEAVVELSRRFLN